MVFFVFWEAKNSVTRTVLDRDEIELLGLLESDRILDTYFLKFWRLTPYLVLLRAERLVYLQPHSASIFFVFSNLPGLYPNGLLDDTLKERPFTIFVETKSWRVVPLCFVGFEFPV